jgi:hypothetical protein
MSHHRWKLRSASILLAPLALAACSEGSFLPTETAGPSFSHNSDPHHHYVDVCKFGEAGTFATFSISATGGEYLLEGEDLATQTFTLWAVPDGTCTTPWRSTNGGGPASVTITEIAWSNGTVLDQLYVNGVSVDPSGRTATVEVYDQDFLIQFKNIGTPEEPDYEGCTPGFWRQAHHHQFWTGFSPAGAWTTAFATLGGTHKEPGRNGATFSDATTLGAAVQFGGGGIFALARHAVAAILNASNPNIDYPLTVAQVQALVNAAIASGNYNGAKDILEAHNELGCDVK